MTPTELETFLTKLVNGNVTISTMIWGAPGIGKSSIVAAVAEATSLQLIDVRLSQLAPTDLRGLPVARHGAEGQLGTSVWYPPEFLPRGGKGILLLDELNMAPPSMQGVAQQLILDRKVGSYQVPEGWYIWAAGNRKEDRASVFEMPAPLGNRFLHVDVQADLDSFKRYAFGAGVSEQMIAFLSFRPELLHRIDPTRPCWPSPRSWIMAARLLEAGLPIAAAIGEPTETEYNAFLSVYGNLPDLDAVLAGNGNRVAFPTELNVRYAVTVGLASRVATAKQAASAMQWIAEKASHEWAQSCALDIKQQMERRNRRGQFAILIKDNPTLTKFFAECQELIAA
jgi:hypothetical protein